MNQEEYINIETESIDRTGEFEVEQAPELPELPVTVPSKPLPPSKPIVYDNPEPNERSFWPWIILITIIVAILMAGGTYLYIKNNPKEVIPETPLPAEIPIINEIIEPVINQTALDNEQKALVLALAEDNWRNAVNVSETIKKAKEKAILEEQAKHRGGGSSGSSVSVNLPEPSTPSEFDGITFDLNEDGIVNATDIKLLRNWKEVWYQNYNNSVDTYTNESTSDWDKNGYIDQTDKDLFEGYWSRLYNYYINVLNVIEDNDSNETI